MLFFFFKQKPAYEMRISYWSSDVCSSDLHDKGEAGESHGIDRIAEEQRGDRRRYRPDHSAERRDAEQQYHVDPQKGEHQSDRPGERERQAEHGRHPLADRKSVV